MRYLVLSDVHANANALDAVLNHARRLAWDEVIFLGDAVGYYTEPERTVAMLRALSPAVRVLGNHDQILLALARGETLDREDGIVLEVLSRHLEELSPESMEFLGTFENRVDGDGWEAVHGAPRRQWEYLSTLQHAQGNLELMQARICLFGHTHVPRIFAAVEGPSGEIWRTVTFRNPRGSYRIPPRARLFFNPGSVGQPRDGIPLASYAVFDQETGSLEVYRVEYDLLGVQRQVRELGYPEVLAKRLAVGK